MSPDDHYRAAERLIDEFAQPRTDRAAERLSEDYRNLLALAQVHATLALCLHPNIARGALR